MSTTEIDNAGYSHYTCACGAVAFRIEADPIIQNWCHCKDCKKWNQTTPVAMLVFPADSVVLVSGAENIDTYHLSKAVFDRCFCKKCGYRLYNKHQEYPFMSIPANNLEEFPYKPMQHIFCRDATAKNLARFVDDGLPKYTDLPEFAGGSGEQVAGI